MTGKNNPVPGLVAPAVVLVTPSYWDEACKHLTKRDRVLKKLIPKFGEARLQSRGDAFTTLARSIVGQQISVKAAQSVWLRFIALFDNKLQNLAPGSVLAQPASRATAARTPRMTMTTISSIIVKPA